MVKYICDICGKEITSGMHTREYKLKKADYNTWTKRQWVKLLIHDSCWKSMCDYIKNSQEEHNS